MAIDKELQQILNEIKNEFKSSIAPKVANKIKQIESDVIEEVVYDAYSPTYYDRRHTEGGLSDTSNMSADYINRKDGIEISVENLTKGNDAYQGAWGYTNGYIQDIITEGKGYGYGLDNVIGARDFITATQERVDTSGEIENVVENELRKLGYLE